MSAPAPRPDASPAAADTERAAWPAGTLLVTIGADELGLDMVGGGSWSLPVGVETLVDGPLERVDRPRPEHLTNALGAVTDHLDDVLIEAPIVASTPGLVFCGEPAVTAARVELGLDEVPAEYVLTRADADEVFRTIVAEPRDERRHNPGLPADEVDTVVAAYCVVLAVLRRLDHQRARVVR